MVFDHCLIPGIANHTKYSPPVSSRVGRPYNTLSALRYKPVRIVPVPGVPVPFTIRQRWGWVTATMPASYSNASSRHLLTSLVCTSYTGKPNRLKTLAQYCGSAALPWHTSLAPCWGQRLCVAAECWSSAAAPLPFLASQPPLWALTRPPQTCPQWYPWLSTTSPSIVRCCAALVCQCATNRQRRQVLLLRHQSAALCVCVHTLGALTWPSAT